jgi:hypothetical protein
VAITIVPIADALNGWRPAFAITALPVLVALPLWLTLRGEGIGPPRMTTKALQSEPRRAGAWKTVISAAIPDSGGQAERVVPARERTASRIASASGRKSFSSGGL